MHKPYLEPQMALPSLSVVVALVVLLVGTPVDGKNPCHEDKGLSGRGVTCTGVWLPPQLCDKCMLKPFLPNGNFGDCSSIYDLTDIACQQQLLIYAEANQHCDPVRYEQTKDFSNSFNRMQLDYFVYSLCEQCCDCVPFGSSTAQFEERQQAGTLLSVYRGNCPAHAHFDVCRIWPRIKYTMRLGNGNVTRHEEWPEACPLLKTWIASDAGDDWGSRTSVSMDGRIARFLGQLLGDASCGTEGTWLQCTALEDAQQRL